MLAIKGDIHRITELGVAHRAVVAVIDIYSDIGDAVSGGGVVQHIQLAVGRVSATPHIRQDQLVGFCHIDNAMQVGRGGKRHTRLGRGNHPVRASAATRRAVAVKDRYRAIGEGHEELIGIRVVIQIPGRHGQAGGEQGSGIATGLGAEHPHGRVTVIGDQHPAQRVRHIKAFRCHQAGARAFNHPVTTHREHLAIAIRRQAVDHSQARVVGNIGIAQLVECQAFAILICGKAALHGAQIQVQYHHIRVAWSGRRIAGYRHASEGGPGDIDIGKARLQIGPINNGQGFRFDTIDDPVRRDVP